MKTGKLDTIVRAPDELRVEADPQRLRQVIENLVTNAIRHSPKGAPVEIDLGSEKRDEDGGGEREWAIVTITDQRPGIAPDLLPRLFTRFAPGPGSTGLGLGLFLSRSIAEAHGGTLTVHSAPGEGTSFRLALPML
jgi:signal transduction histidine kinase